MPVADEYENDVPLNADRTPAPPVLVLQVFATVKLPEAFVCVNVTPFPNEAPTTNETVLLESDEVTAPGAGVGVGLGDELPPPPHAASATSVAAAMSDRTRTNCALNGDNTKSSLSK
jgi:hypothetical protein